MPRFANASLLKEIMYFKSCGKFYSTPFFTESRMYAGQHSGQIALAFTIIAAGAISSRFLTVKVLKDTLSTNKHNKKKINYNR